MSTLGLVFFHVGFIIGAFMLSLVVGTLVFYFRKEEPSFVGCGARFIERTSDERHRISTMSKEESDCEQVYDTHPRGTVNQDFEDIKIVFPLRQTDWPSRHGLSNSPSS